MGNDGGSIPTRRELVREAARNPSSSMQVKEAQREQLSHHWTTCPLSHKPLTRPIVSDSVGNLYNKDAILRFLLPGEDESGGIISKADCEEILQGRVKSLRDVVELQFEIDTEHVQIDRNPCSGRRSERWICPITTKELGPNVKSVYLVPCGHVFSEEAIREMKGDKCLTCNEPYTEDNVIPILPTKEEEKQRLIARGHKLAEQGLTHSLKKASGSKKRKKHAANGESAESSSSSSQTPTTQPSSSQSTSSSAGIKNAATAMLTARVLEEENEKKKRQKMMGRNENLQSLFHSNNSNKEKPKDGDFMTRGYTIPAGARR
ncbi:hypothetical protein VTN77DRAFT_1742 [Rasamsonia byssochlamydoides]|uniref:uncharacterized protein n=1 Tax=Rasamsonia byssochlamydoides TaxID=89139 RepID=UPI0037422134